MIQVIACPYSLFVWPQKATNPGWSFIWGQSLCLQWHHKCRCRENNGWWIQREPGTVDSRDGPETSSVMESFRPGPTPWPNNLQKMEPEGGGVKLLRLFQSWWRGGGAALLGSSGYKCLYEALCRLETVRDGALLLGEERRFVFIGCLECVEDCGHLLY